MNNLAAIEESRGRSGKAERLYRQSLAIHEKVLGRGHPQVAYAGDPLSGEVRLEVDIDGQTFESGWKTGRDAPFGRYTRLALEFAAPGSHVLLALELRGRWALPLGAWYVDALGLAAV